MLVWGEWSPETPAAWAIPPATIMAPKRYIPFWPDAIRRLPGRRVKIILSHQPPRGAQDTLYSGESSGSTGLCRFLEDFQPDLLLCGHIHEARGESLVGECRVVNVGEMRRGFAVMVEIGDEISVRWI